jgi:hypothetical protein
LTKRVTNVAASAGQRLRNIARERDEDFSLVLTKFALERVLFRLSQSGYQDVFVLKGALLSELWTQERYRTTRDADFLARGDFYDLWKLSRDFPFDGPLLSEAMRKTFARWETELPTGKLPIVFTEEFYQDEIKSKQWNAFCQKNRQYISELLLEEVCIAIRSFLVTIVEALVRNDSLQKHWNPSALEINHRGFVFRRHRHPPPSVRIPAVASNAHCSSVRSLSLIPTMRLFCRKGISELVWCLG